MIRGPLSPSPAGNSIRMMLATRLKGIFFTTACPLIAAAALGGCVYRPNIQQGNFLKTEDVDQVTAGMTRSQVRYLLGTPMISDPFTAQRWDYIYTLKRGHQRKIDRSHFIVYFDGD